MFEPLGWLHVTLFMSLVLHLGNLGDTTLALRFKIGKLTRNWQPNFDKVIQQNQKGKKKSKKVKT